MQSQPNPSAADLARYLERRGDLTRPWNLQMLRLQKLKEEKASLAPEDYMARLEDAHRDLMRLGQFWKGREREVFGGDGPQRSDDEPSAGSTDNS